MSNVSAVVTGRKYEISRFLGNPVLRRPGFHGEKNPRSGTAWKINMEPTKHPFRKENDLPNLQCSMLILPINTHNIRFIWG